MATEQINQELEDAAEQSAKSIGDLCSRASRIGGFKDGATWKAEQVANDTIEFSKWWFNHGFTYNRKENHWRKYPSEKKFTDKEMIEIWQQTRNK